MDRKPIAVGQLIAILNQRMMRYPETSRCRITSVAPLMVKDKVMCNWSPTVSWNANGQNRDIAMPIIRKMVIGAQKEFDLLPFGSVKPA